MTARHRSLALLAIAGLATSALATDFHIPLNYNWNGVLHAGEGTNPDDPTGFRSMSDRAFYVDVSDTHALGTSPIVGSTGITYNVVTTPGVLDMVHLGNTGTGTSRTWDAAAGGTANRGTMPTWLPATDSHTQPQVTDVTSMNLTIDANSSISVLYNVSNGGGTFQVVLGFTDASTVTLTLSANDWFGATNPPAAAAGVASQTRLGGTTYTGTSNIDLPTIQPWPTQALAASEAVITPQSIAQAGLGNIVGRQLASLTFQNTNQPTRGYAIYAATVVTGLGPPTNDTCATPIDLADGTTACTSVRATGSTPSACGSIDTADVWYRYHASASGPVEARTCGAPFDTTLAVYSSCAGPAIACNDNGCGLASRLQWNAVAGQNYLIRVAGNGGTTGTFDLTIDPAPPTHTDTAVPLAYNWNGIAHPSESGVPDDASGFRSISDRALYADGLAGAVNAGLLTGTDFIPYTIVRDAGQLDTVHLGLTGVGSPRQWDTVANGDGRGVIPTWLSGEDQSGPQRSNLAPLNLAMGADTRLGVIYHVSNNGGTMDLTLEFADGSNVTMNLQAPDWFQSQTPNPPSGALEVQRELGVFSAVAGQDLATTGAPGLNLVEAVLSTQSIFNAGLGNVTGKRLTGLVIQNGVNSSASGFALYAATLRDAVPNTDPVPPSGLGSVVPSLPEAGRSALLRIAVTPGQNPTSTGLNVSVDLQSIGGSSDQAFYDDASHGDVTPGDGIYSFATTLSAGQTPGPYTLPFTVSDAQSRSTQGAITFTLNAYTWNEQTDGQADAGDLPGTAQVPQGSGALGAISGDLGADDVDMFAIDICDPGAFSATAVGGATFDTQMTLFSASGLGIAFDDDSNTVLQSTVTGLFVPSPGLYYVAIARYDRDAVDEVGQELWLDTPFATERAPDGPGAANPLAAWIGTTAVGGAYRITLAGACFVTVVACDPDVNQDGNADQEDVRYLVNVVGGGDNPTNIDPDFNHDGNVDQTDIAELINVVAGGACP